MISIKSLIVSILIPNIIGFLGGLIGGSFNGFNSITQPSFTPPSIVFPTAWSILYILMGISSYLIYKSTDPNKSEALTVYGIQLVLNALWNIFFFRLHWFLFAFIWLIILLITVIIMVYKFYKVNKTASYLQIPYILWLIFAAVLNYSVFLIN